MPSQPRPSSDPSAGLAGTLQSLVNSVGAYFYAKDLQGRYLFANEAVCRLFGARPDQVLGAEDGRFLDLQRSAGLLANDRRVLEQGQEVHEEEELTLLSGESRWFWTVKVPIRDAQGALRGLCGISTDITDRPRAAEELIERNQLLSTILSNVDAYVYLKDHEGRYRYANQKVVELYGRPAHDIVGHTDLELLKPEVASRLVQLDRSVLDSSTRQAREELVIGADGCERHFWSIKLPLKLPGQPPCLIGFSTEITELLALKQHLERQRVTDPLTGLPNRHQFEAELALELRVAEREPQQGLLAVVLLDLDQFKYVNSSLGQQVGDQLLRAVAERLGQCDIAMGSLARLSGDEFAITLPGIAAADEAAAIVERVRAALAQPFTLAGRPLHLNVSAGISLFPDDGRSGATLLAHAESAMYFAKERGRDQYRFYSHELGAAVAQRLELERDLRGALAAGQFELHYQPKIRAADGEVAGCEALLRWHREGHGMVSPAQFIPLAEQLGLLGPIGNWVIKQACRQVAAWRDAGVRPVPVAVNLSPSQLSNPALRDFVSQTLAAHGIGDGGIEMEVTESMMMDDPEQAIAMLHALRGLGVHLSIDDFGTGYSSMAYLKRLPVVALKLDRSFVTHIASDPRDADLCAGVIALAHQLGLSVVAEGVETEAQRQALAARGCDLFQGYLFSRPLPAQQATDYLLAHRPDRR